MRNTDPGDAVTLTMLRQGARRNLTAETTSPGLITCRASAACGVRVDLRG